MEQITAIQAQKRKGRYNIFINGKYSFAVSEATLIKFQLHKGQEISKEEISQITNAEQIAKAYNKALDFLSYQLRSEREIIDYLAKHDFNENEINLALKKLREQNLLNDLEYAKSYTRTMAKTSDKGPNIIRQNLRKKGIGENNIDDALLEFSDEMQLANISKLIKKLQKKYQRESFNNQLQKIKKSLLTKGFALDLINQALEKSELTKDEENEQEQLEKLGNKLLQRYRNLESFKRNQKVKMALYRKGFSMDDINVFIENIEKSI